MRRSEKLSHNDWCTINVFAEGGGDCTIFNDYLVSFVWSSRPSLLRTLLTLTLWLQTANEAVYKTSIQGQECAAVNNTVLCCSILQWSLFISAIGIGLRRVRVTLLLQGYRQPKV